MGINRLMSLNQFILALNITFSLAIIGCSEVRQKVYSDEIISQPVDTLSLAFAIGEELGDSTDTFGSIIDVVVSGDNQILVLDDAYATVKVFDLEGNYLQQVTRRGDAPGELGKPRSLGIMPDGRLVLSSPSNQGFVIFDSSFHFLEEISLWYNNSPYDIAGVSNSEVAICRYDEDPNNDFIRHTLGIYSLGSTNCEVLLWKDSMEVTESIESSDPSQSDIFCLFNLLEISTDSSGNIYFAPINQFEYRVIVWNSAGSEILNFTQNTVPVEKTIEEIESEVMYMNGYYRNRAANLPSYEFNPLPYRNIIEEVGIGPDGNLWVQRGTRTDLFFDIFNLDGVLLRHAVYPIESWSWETEITPHGILAWELDPLDGYQKLYLVR